MASSTGGAAQGAPSGTSGGSALRSALLLAGAAAGALTLANALLFRLAPEPSHLLGGAFDRYPARLGDVAYTVRGSGPPILLLHGWGAGNSMIEWANVIELLSESHTVYALDFPGWGLSDKPKVRHTAASYIELVSFFLEDIVRQPCALIASSGASAIAIEVAAAQPTAVSKLVLVCPPPGGEKDATDPARIGMESLLRAPGLSTALYLSLASRASIDKFTREQLFFDPSRGAELWAGRFYANAHQLDAPYALHSFLSGSLDVDARAAWAGLSQPALLLWGRNARLSPLDGAPEWMALKPDARLAVVDDAMQLPHAEHGEKWSRLVLDFLGS